jgi:hypothetical protein
MKKEKQQLSRKTNNREEKKTTQLIRTQLGHIKEGQRISSELYQYSVLW